MTYNIYHADGHIEKVSKIKKMPTMKRKWYLFNARWSKTFKQIMLISIGTAILIFVADIGWTLHSTHPTFNIVTDVHAANFPVAGDRSEPVEALILRLAREQGFQWPDYLIRLAKCESSLNPWAIGVNTDGSLDLGVFQWNMKHHPEISRACAFDTTCATQKTMEAINNGHQSWWMCNAKI